MNGYQFVLSLLLLLLVIVGVLVIRVRRRHRRGLLVLALNESFSATYRGRLSHEEQGFWKRELLSHIAYLRQMGWLDEAISLAYLSDLEAPEFADVSEHATYLAHRLEQAGQFGSPLFQQMWRSSVTQASPEKAKQLLQVALRCLEMPQELSGEISETKRLLSKFSSVLEPAHSFWSVLALTVQIAFPKESLARKGTFERQIHQLRYVISSQQAQWVREYYRKDDQTDAQALASYIQHLAERNQLLALLGVDNYKSYFDYELTESARLHNKLPVKKWDKERSKGQTIGMPCANLKILLRFHTEFILDEAGHFLNEIDMEGISDNAIINGASFNYANSNNRRHRSLDVLPVKHHDPAFRKRLLRKGALPYMAPNRVRRSGAEGWEFSYYNPQGYFSYEGQSARQRVIALQQAFEKLLRTADSTSDLS